MAGLFSTISYYVALPIYKQTLRSTPNQANLELDRPGGEGGTRSVTGEVFEGLVTREFEEDTFGTLYL